MSTVAGGSTGTNVGFADGAAITQALFSWPHHAMVDAAGNIVVGDTLNQRVRRIAPNGGTTLVVLCILKLLAERVTARIMSAQW